MDLSWRIRELLAARHKSQIELAEYMKVSQSFINAMVNGKKKVSFENLNQICTFLDVTLAEFFKPFGNAEEVPAHMLSFFKTCESLEPNEIEAIIPIINLIKATKQNAGRFSNVKQCFLPILGSAAAGTPIFDLADAEATITVPERYCDGRFFVVSARGNSMHPVISDGDYVIAQKNAVPERGSLALVRIADTGEDQYTIKYFYPANNDIELQSENLEYKSMHFKKSEVISVDKVVHVIRKQQMSTT